MAESIRSRLRRKLFTTSHRPEVVALRRTFDYLQECIDVDSVIPAALAKGLITYRQRSRCSGKASDDEKAEQFLEYLQKSVKGSREHFDTFLQILEGIGQEKVAERLRDELSKVLHPLQPQDADELIEDELSKVLPSPQSQDTDEQLTEEQEVEVPEILVQELVNLRTAYANLLTCVKKAINSRSKARRKFIDLLGNLLPGDVSSNCNFHSAFEILKKKELSLFNIYYLKSISPLLPKNIRATTEQLIRSYEDQLGKFKDSTTVAQFKELFPASAVTSELSAGKKHVIMKLQNIWGEHTLEDLDKLVHFLLGVSANHLHLSKVSPGSIAVHWLCPTDVVPELEKVIIAATALLYAEGIQQVTIAGRFVLNPTKDSLRKEFHFITEPSQNVCLCPVCTDLLMEPFLTDCGHHLCRMCHDRLLTNSQAECPLCHKPNVLKDAQENKHLQQQVYDLKVYCKHREDGCKWTGELRNLQEHLDPNRRRCDFVLIPCSFGCGMQVQNCMMKEHKKSHCHKRQSTCEHCGYYNTHDVVTEEHYPICPQFPVDCPNKCQAGELKRHQLQAHIDKCPLQEIECPYTSVGCNVRVTRREMEIHTEQQHLLPVPKQMGPLVRDVTLSTLPVWSPYPFNLPPVEFTMTDYLHWKESGEEWTSPPFYTHQEGYKMCIEVHANGRGYGKGTHVSVFACLMRGEHDNHLQWPFEADVVTELLNWSEDKGHHDKTINLNSELSRVTNGKSPLFHQFISHSSLSYNPTTNTKYLQDDCLRLRIKAVEFYSTSPFIKTPAWQDPLTDSQSLCEFTVTEFSKRKHVNNRYYSRPFYTHTQGYKMCLEVIANGDSSGKGTHVSVFACLMTGENDNQLQWPFEGDVIIELLNWKEDKGHQEYTVSFDRYRSITFGTPISEGDVGAGFGIFQFISHSSLSYNPTTNTEYLQDDCLRLRVKTVVVYSTPRVHKTPAWHESLTASQSPCEFTVTEFSKRKHFDNRYYSPPFYTHPQGYKMCLVIGANGFGSGKGTHVSVFASLMRGEHDDQLQWPFEGDVIIELLNWKRDRRHHKHTIHFNSYSESVSTHCARVTDRDVGDAWGTFRFISHSSLFYNCITNNEYLQDDCLRLRVCVIVHSKHKPCVIA